ncbi:MAG TPA: hypothetical protein VK157_06220 [Phycisphaerales bacterium]|nr:hypothetical protein [Phycisphaerales bacterium]
MQTKHIIAFTLIACGGTSVATAQTGQYEPASSRLFYQVFDTTTNAWTTSTTVTPGSRIEWRALVSYTGTNTSVSALGGVTYQPTLSNIDNDDADGSRDELGAWRAASSPVVPPPSSILSREEGEFGGVLPSYGRVQYGAIAMNSSSLNTMTTFRHAGSAAGAPAGSWFRVAGLSVTSWPVPELPTAADATAANLNAINRGVFSSQQSAVNPITLAANTFHSAGTQNLVIFRGALILSDQADPRAIELSTAAGTQQRIGAVADVDDRRYMTWQTSSTDSGSWRSGVVLESATINVIPSPGSITAIAVGVACVVRRRRS